MNQEIFMKIKFFQIKESKQKVKLRFFIIWRIGVLIITQKSQN